MIVESYRQISKEKTLYKIYKELLKFKKFEMIPLELLDIICNKINRKLIDIFCNENTNGKSIGYSIENSVGYLLNKNRIDKYLSRTIKIRRFDGPPKVSISFSKNKYLEILGVYRDKLRTVYCIK